jgi:riboflavin synthase
MFTGIVKEQGLIRLVRRAGAITRLEIESDQIHKTSAIGGSVAVNGVCLTIVAKKGSILSFDVMEETMRRSNLNNAGSGYRVNLEEAVKANSTLGGHFVLGHIDCVGKIKMIQEKENCRRAEIEMPRQFNHLVVDKGSITIDGISLTVGEARDGSFSVYLIPHTLKSTDIGAKKSGDSVNIEFDIIGKYIARFNNYRPSSNLTEDFLKQKGFA